MTVPAALKELEKIEKAEATVIAKKADLRVKK